MWLLLLGPPGSGKGTIGELVAKQLRLHRVLMGDIVREEVRKGTNFGKKADQSMRTGKLIPDREVVGLFQRKIREIKNTQGAILDGFPRTVGQAALIGKEKGGKEKGNEKKNPRIDAILYLHAPERTLLRRMTSRRICPHGHVFNLLSRPPQKKGICDHCHAHLIQRPDDTAEVARKRIQVYHHSTQKLINYYLARHYPFISVSSVYDPKIVSKRILAKLSTQLMQKNSRVRTLTQRKRNL